MFIVIDTNILHGRLEPSASDDFKLLYDKSKSFDWKIVIPQPVMDELIQGAKETIEELVQKSSPLTHVRTKSFQVGKNRGMRTAETLHNIAHGTLVLNILLLKKGFVLILAFEAMCAEYLKTWSCYVFQDTPRGREPILTYVSGRTTQYQIVPPGYQHWQNPQNP